MLSQENIPAARAVLQNFNEELGIYINDNDRHKLGEVLTIVDASIPDADQRKAVKDLINRVWWGRSDRMSSGAMSNPHTDIRAIARVLGFELYEKSNIEPDFGYGDTFAEDRYKKLAQVK